jgi:hypothetical protein
MESINIDDDGRTSGERMEAVEREEASHERTMTLAKRVDILTCWKMEGRGVHYKFWRLTRLAPCAGSLQNPNIKQYTPRVCIEENVMKD